MSFESLNFTVAMPEMILAIAAMLLLVVGAFSNGEDNAARRVGGLTIVAFIASFMALLSIHNPGDTEDVGTCSALLLVLYRSVHPA